MEGEELVELLKLHDSVYDQANNWFTSLKDNMKSQILSHFGNLPSKDPDPQVCTHQRPFNTFISHYCTRRDENMQ